MPVIQQERGVKSVAGLPLRWGRRAYAELSAALRNEGHHSDRYKNLCRLLDDVTAAPLPLDATDAHLCVLAERFAAECAAFNNFIHDAGALRDRMALVCRQHGIVPPLVRDPMQAVMRCTDPAWWRRNLRRVHGRAFEAAAIRLGFVSVRAGAYASNETVGRRLAQTARNRAAMEAVRLRNEDGAEFSQLELANKGTGNKRIRRGELMLRLAGCEDVANEAGHAGVFVTLTAPSKYHAVLAKSGTTNPTYNDTTPRQVQAYLQKTWARIRAAYGRHGIKPYGFRIAEPHHDGCVHWHMLVFMPAHQVRRFTRTVAQYALMEDGDEPGARTNRVKFERIDTRKGTAAAYIAKYISKNIDDDTEDAHDEVVGADGELVKLTMSNNGANKASQRVDAWAGVWGIRQFQPIGQPPVTVWRELRRVSEAEVQGASDAVRQAWDAAQRVERTDDDGAVIVEKVASYGDYIRAQGGVCMGRDYRIAVAVEPGVIMAEGRYGLAPREFPIGVYERTAPETVYASTRYTWERVSARAPADRPWSPVNNCTPWPSRPSGADAWYVGVPPGEPVAEFDEAWFDTEEYRAMLVSPVEAGDDWHAAELAAAEQRAKTVWTVPSYANRVRNYE
ncbi:replication endonuclease [Massilia timonae]|uniref:replication endonuclease n=1 Tax=Massilia timonae TaxID=47229 RepID=UPI0028D1FFE4|nr:replication endonuclease [Massilia timonae]